MTERGAADYAAAARVIEGDHLRRPDVVHLRIVPLFAPDVIACQRHTVPRGGWTTDRSQVTCPDCVALIEKENESDGEA